MQCKIYVALNSFKGTQNAVALVHDDLKTFEVIDHFNEPESAALSESALNRLPDGAWMAICRSQKGNYHFTTSQDGKTWERKYRLENPQSFQYPTFHEHEGTIWLSVTQGRKERIMFGKLESSIP